MIPSRLAPRDSLLFVYGTLRPLVRIPMAEWLERVAHYSGRARTRGRLYDLGPYPGLRAPRSSGDWVIGDLYRLPTPSILRVLDRYEAGTSRGRPRFVRRRCTVVLPCRRRRCAWLYVYRPVTLGRPRIAHGDYGSFLSQSR
jgi:gamma-glutamylcyclotransferase (GGCT)/AIG2-like uncharacterized protein YtfP